jgi:hypothetical protein
LCGVFTVSNCSSVQFVNSCPARCSSSWSTGVDCHITKPSTAFHKSCWFCSSFIAWSLPLLPCSLSFMFYAVRRNPVVVYASLREQNFT